MNETSTTYEEATKCPKCGLPGDVASRTKSGRRPGAQVHMVFCRNKACKWHNTSWVVQVNKDGSIPEPYQQLGNKMYPKLSQESQTRVEEAIQTQLNAETKPGGEIRNPHG